MEAWTLVYETLVGVIDMDHVLKQLLPVVTEMAVLKNPFPKRKRGNRLVSSLAKKLGEKGIEKDPMILKLILAICHDTNYKIRMDGVMFFKDYLKNKEVQAIPRFKSTYLPELIELLNDEETYIRIEVIEIMTELLHLIDRETIENEFIPVVVSTMEVTIEEILVRLAQISG